MRIFIIGAGAREHALMWSLRRSPQVEACFCAPGNAGTALLGANIPLPIGNLSALADWAAAQDIGLTIVGPEAPLDQGIVDLFTARGLPIFGPTQAAARLESSKSWTKDLLQGAGIPTARSQTFTASAAALAHINRPDTRYPVVIKADGLAAGKGVVIAATPQEASAALRSFMVTGELGAAGQVVVIEEYLEGREVSLLALTDGKTIVPLLPACDYKRVYDGNQGPNTGGMGAFAPPDFVDVALLGRIHDTILAPTLAALGRRGIVYRGVMYAGLILTTDGPKALEYNARFGDPEAQVILPLLDSDLYELLEATRTGRLDEVQPRWKPGAACGIVLAAGGYPGQYQTGDTISGLETVDPDVLVFHAGTNSPSLTPLAAPSSPAGITPQTLQGVSQPTIQTAGGRVLTLVATGQTLADAHTRAYANADRIIFAGRHYRTDIGG